MPVTPKGITSYPHLLEKKVWSDGKEEFSVELIFEDGSELDEVRKVVEQCANDEWGHDKPASIRSPFMTKSDFNMERAELTDSSVVLRFKTQYEVQVVDQHKNPITDPKKVYGGCIGRCVYDPYAWTMGGNSGVSLALKVYQFVDDGDKEMFRKNRLSELDELPDVGEDPLGDLI